MALMLQGRLASYAGGLLPCPAKDRRDDLSMGIHHDDALGETGASIHEQLFYASRQTQVRVSHARRVEAGMAQGWTARHEPCFAERGTGW